MYNSYFHKNSVHPYGIHPVYFSTSANRKPWDSMKEKHEKCLRKLHNFAEETTVHGVLNVVRSDRSWFSRLIWAIAFTACLGGCVYLLGASIARYLRYEVITTESIQTENEIEFPSITICNENLGRRSYLGGSAYFLKSLTAFILSNPTQYEDRLESVKSTCKSDGETNLSKLLDQLNYKSWTHFGYTKIMRQMATDSYYSIVSCWWKDQEKEDCNRYFLNHLTDYGWCFSFNLHPDLIRSYVLGFNDNSSAYGLSNDYKMLKIRNAGQNNGFRILLNAHQDDYCISRHDSVGFKISVHDPRMQPLFFLDQTVGVSPGFETRIGIKLRRLEKQTQHLNKCTMFQALYMYPNIKVYFKEACYMQCFSEFIYKNCMCIPPFGPPRANYIVAGLLNLTYVNVCWDNTMLCMKKYERQFLDSGLQSGCSGCLNPCSQLYYDLQTSQLYFPVKSWLKMHPDIEPNVSRNMESFRENYALVDFYVESMSMTVVTEIHAFTLEQLVADIGGQIGFLLGMSVLSLLEFIELLLPNKKPQTSTRRSIKKRNHLSLLQQKRMKY